MSSDWRKLCEASKRACLLCISATGHRFIFIVLQQDTSEGGVMYIFYDVPFYRKAANPFVLPAPKVHVVLVVNRANHLSNSTEMWTSVDLLDHNIGLSNSSSRTWNQTKEVKHLKLISTHRKEQQNWAQGRTTCSYHLSISECSI